MDWEAQLISIFVYICQCFKKGLFINGERLSPNNKPEFDDCELLAVYVWGLVQGHDTKDKIYQYTKQHLADWFPKIPGYKAFVARLNRISVILPDIMDELINKQVFMEKKIFERVIDSMPIIIAKSPRSGAARVASEFANKGYNSSKETYYYGVKLHILGILSTNHLPLMEYMTITPASVHDLNVLKDIAEDLYDTRVYADKAFVDEDVTEQLSGQGTSLITPIKRKRNDPPLTLFQEAYNTCVSKVRQPIEAFFSWLVGKSHIQTASRVRSLKGLMVHIYGCLLAAMMISKFKI